jgi:hypothetical protein
MKQIVRLTGLFLLLLTGCSTVTPAKHYGDTKLDSLKSAYVVIAASGNPNIAGYIVTALARHNLKTSRGPLKDKPADVAFYVNYREHWNWDVVVYLDTLDVEFMDNATGKMIASGSFRNSKFMESWPNPRDKSIEVVDSMFAKQ